MRWNVAPELESRVAQSSIRMTDSSISNCTAGATGGAVSGSYAYRSFADNFVDVSRCVVTNCKAGTDGGGFYLRDSYILALVECTVSYCRAARGGAVSLQSDSR